MWNIDGIIGATQQLTQSKTTLADVHSTAEITYNLWQVTTYSNEAETSNAETRRPGEICRKD